MIARLVVLLAAVLPIAANGEVTVRYLANEGYLVSDGNEAVLLDAFVPEPYHDYAPVADDDWQAILAGEPPFDSIVAAVASHEHADHVQELAATRYLEKNPEVILYTTPAAAELLEPPHDDAIESILPDYRESTVRRAGAFRLTFLRLAHNPERENDVQNLGTLVEIDDLRILHMGDAFPVAENLSGYGLPELGIDLAIVPEWFFMSQYFPEGASLVKEHIGADRVIMTHYSRKGLRERIEAYRSEYPWVEHLSEPGDETDLE